MCQGVKTGEKIGGWGSKEGDGAMPAGGARLAGAWMAHGDKRMKTQ